MVEEAGLFLVVERAGIVPVADRNGIVKVVNGTGWLCSMFQRIPYWD